MHFDQINEAKASVTSSYALSSHVSTQEQQGKVQLERKFSSGISASTQEH
jgi:hypothetical protein